MGKVNTKKKRCQTIDRKVRLLELVEKSVLKKILKSFTNATGLVANIVDTKGQPILGLIDVEHNCKFCRHIWDVQKGFDRCQGAYARAGKQAAMYKQPYIFRCPAGLIEWAAPLIINGEHLGSIICGQVLMWEPEDFFWIELQEMNKGLGVEMKSLIEAAKELEVVSGEKVQAAADLLFVTANYIMKAGWEKLLQSQEIMHQQSLLTEEIQNRKELEERLNIHKFNLEYPLEKERELVSKVKLGDQEAAKKILQEILVDIFIVGAAKIQEIKFRVLELIVLLSRAAVEGGADYEQSLKVNTKFFHSINKSNTMDGIALTSIQALEGYMEAILDNSTVKNHQLINQVKRYIRDNIFKKLNLKEIAGSVFLSPYYVSRMFKEEVGITVMDYVTKVRMEEAKKLLHNPGYNINDIAERLGFSDPSHFSKVFRRNEGMSPSDFRKQA